MRYRNKLVQMNVGKDEPALDYAIKVIDMLLDGELVPAIEKGGYMAKGGLTEHGLKVGDTIVDNMFWDKSVKVLNSKTGYAVVHLETGERKEMKAMGGEMHRTQE
jgi:hypothetical protein